ncbi:OLC1v1003361C2 [Oldenlandia corymbosa var. corymbosa]|uniref:Dihydroflavonol 4-reductase n=1 Tax=Oldenlandia corymbosa var. corymbosa TaxID=529605 RepID=A0AAV1DA17_OLDCO|nr:OLC1v1003361C2 [Oldenlandia corymbosa var. corymbosa]
MEEEEKGRVCVTGGTGFVGSWLIKRLLEDGYIVNTTIRSSSTPADRKHISYLTDLPGATERLQIFNADLSKPESFAPAVEGCIGVFHVAHPIDFEGRETEEAQIKKSVDGTIGILQACLNSKTVRRVVYTSSAATVIHTDKDLDVVDENIWSDVDYIRKNLSHFRFATYSITKVLTEKAALDFGEKSGLDLVSIIPTWVHGPFLCPFLPGSVLPSMSLIFGNQEHYSSLLRICFVHTDDLARAHIFLFENPEAKGRYICSAVEMTIDKLAECLSAKYPEYPIPTVDSLKGITGFRSVGVSSKKLLDLGFNYNYGIEEMFDDAIKCCKEKGFL